MLTPDSSFYRLGAPTSVVPLGGHGLSLVPLGVLKTAVGAVLQVTDESVEIRRHVEVTQKLRTKTQNRRGHNDRMGCRARNLIF
jgi:hypothetical protein